MVQRGNPVVIRPTCRESAEVQNETAWHDRHVYPDTRLGIYLKAAWLVLAFQYGEAPIVAVGACSELPWLRRRLWGGIVPHSQATDVLVDLVVEKPLRSVEGDGKKAHQSAGEVGHDAAVCPINLA